MIVVAVRACVGEFKLELATQIPLEGITGSLGPSGSGKTTLLRVLAGFERAEGRIIVSEDVWLDTKAKTCVPPHKRSVGYIFQDARLFDHLSVAGNLEYAFSRSLTKT